MRYLKLWCYPLRVTERPKLIYEFCNKGILSIFDKQNYLEPEVKLAHKIIDALVTLVRKITSKKIREIFRYLRSGKISVKDEKIKFNLTIFNSIANFFR